MRAALQTLAVWIGMAIMWAIVFGLPALVGALDGTWNR